jgi:hypothetical protein
MKTETFVIGTFFSGNNRPRTAGVPAVKDEKKRLESGERSCYDD